MARCSAAKATGNPETNFMVCACPAIRYIDDPLRVIGLCQHLRNDADLEKAPGEPFSQVAYGTPQVSHTASM